MAAQIIKQFLSQIAWGELDYLIIDYPPGTGDIQLTISQVAPVTAAIIVTTPQEVALIDVRKAISMFDTLKVPVLGIVETMSYFVCDSCDKKHHIFRTGGGERLAGEYGLPLLGQIPIDPVITAAADEGKAAVYASSPAGDAYRAAAGEAARHLSILHTQSPDALQQFSIMWK
jgi:ATP-binding protein involved in chromosome partitioning